MATPLTEGQVRDAARALVSSIMDIAPGKGEVYGRRQFTQASPEVDVQLLAHDAEARGHAPLELREELGRVERCILQLLENFELIPQRWDVAEGCLTLQLTLNRDLIVLDLEKVSRRTHPDREERCSTARLPRALDQGTFASLPVREFPENRFEQVLPLENGIQILLLVL